MATERQFAANRENAQKSTGPKTPEGRAAVRLNGVKHGLSAETLVLPGENADDLEALIDSLEAQHQPATPTEEILVRQFAMAAADAVNRNLLLNFHRYEVRLERSIRSAILNCAAVALSVSRPQIRLELDVHVLRLSVHAKVVVAGC